ncbi:XRE family transcriptional regulator [Bacillus cereus]|nr:XRE family transcriptional regulator [Bacillus cereus]
MKIALFIFELIEKEYDLKMIQMNLLEYKIKKHS